MYKGELTGFPTQVVEKMLERQVAQRFVGGVAVFESFAGSGSLVGGFNWGPTKEGDSFWQSVIIKKDFDLFFEKYPKEFKSETLPEFWVVFNNGEPEFQKVIDYLFEKHGKRWYSSTNYIFGFDGNSNYNGTNWHSQVKSFNNNPVILTLEKFIQLTEKKMEKEIKGYKLIKPEYKEAVKIITFSSAFDFEGFEKDIKEFDISLERLHKAEVLNLWFEKIYKSDQTVYTMGEPGNTFEVVVKDGKAVYKDIDITEIVQAIQTRVGLPYRILISNKYLLLHNAILSIPGPETENDKAPFSQWLAIKL